MNPFFAEREGWPIPGRVYARLIDASGSRNMLFDAIDADWFDNQLPQFGPAQNIDAWRGLADTAPIYAIEVNSRNRSDAKAVAWLKYYRKLLRFDPAPWGGWFEIVVVPNGQGPAEVYGNISGPAQRADLLIAHVGLPVLRSLISLTDLTPYAQPGAVIAESLPLATIRHVIALDVGQGSANALVSDAGDVVAYVDIGAGVLADTQTWPNSMTNFCIASRPVIVLTHWHYDHFHGANMSPAAKSVTWIAPNQKIGAGPQLAMATDIISNGTLMIWSGTGRVGRGQLELERCTGPASDPNRTGLAVWIDGPSPQDDPILLPGDAGYRDIPALHWKSVLSLAAAHHCGRSPGRPPLDSGNAMSRVVLSYGHNNSYGHPLTRYKTRLVGAGWSVGHPGYRSDERRTEDRPGGVGGTGLGHVELGWPGSGPLALPCACGCSMTPTQ